MFFVDINSGDIYDLDKSIFKLYREKAPQLEDALPDDDHPDRDPKLSDREHYKLWVDCWNAEKDSKHYWIVTDYWTPKLFEGKL